LCQFCGNLNFDSQQKIARDKGYIINGGLICEFSATAIFFGGNINEFQLIFIKLNFLEQRA
jgi:hypothetical protein